MPNPNTKGISVHIDRELHTEITAYLQEHNMKMADFIALAAQDMLRPPTPELDPDLHAEIMAYLEEHDMTMDEFFARAAQKELHPQVPGIDARLQTEIVALLLDKRNWEKIACPLLAVFILVVLPVMALAAAFSTEGIDFTDPEIIAEIMNNLTPEQIEELQFVEDTVQDFHLAMADRTPQQIKAADVLFLLALYDQAQEPDFIEKLAGCFEESQTDEQLIAEVNAAFGSALDPDDFSAIMNYANHQLVESAKSQLGNVGGQPYWSWYGFGGRVEWCACFVSCVRKRWASPPLPMRLYRPGYHSQVFQLHCRLELVQVKRPVAERQRCTNIRHDYFL